MQSKLLLGVIAFAAAGCIHPLRPMKDPPAFGSNAQLSTVGGFLQGEWLTRAEGFGQLSKMSNALEKSFPTVLTFDRNGAFEMSSFGSTVHGTWKESGASIVLTPNDVDGYSHQKILEEKQKWDAYRGSGYSMPGVRDTANLWHYRSSDWDEASIALFLDADGKRLSRSDPKQVTPDSPGQEFWVRASR